MDLPDKLTFKRNEVIKLAKLEGKVIDFWQKEFQAFSPMVNHSGEQFYTREALELILKIKQWLIVEKINKLKIKEKLKAEKNNFTPQQQVVNNDGDFEEKIQDSYREKLKIMKLQLHEILTILDKNDKK